MFRCTWILALFICAFAQAIPNKKDCTTQYQKLSRYYQLSLKQYGRDIVESKGVRLILKDPPQTQREERLLGFLTEYQPPAVSRWYHKASISAMLQWVPRKVSTHALGKPYDFRPIRGIVYNLVTRPVRSVTKRISGRQKDFSNWITIPSGLGAFLYAYEKADEFYKKRLSQRILDRIEEDKALWDKLLEFDFRYHDLRQSRDSGKLTPSAARVEAYLRHHFLSAYFTYMENDFANATKEESREFFFGQPAFFHIQKLVAQGIPQSEQYLYDTDFSPTLSQEQIDALIELNLQLQATLDVLPALAQGDAAQEALKDNPTIEDLAKSLQADPFAQFLFSLKARGILSPEQLGYRLQEDAFWQVRFEEQAILHLAKRRLLADGTASTEPLTLEDVRNEAILEIRAESGR